MKKLLFGLIGIFIIGFVVIAAVSVKRDLLFHPLVMKEVSMAFFPDAVTGIKEKKEFTLSYIDPDKGGFVNETYVLEEQTNEVYAYLLERAATATPDSLEVGECSGCVSEVDLLEACKIGNLRINSAKGDGVNKCIKFIKALDRAQKEYVGDVGNKDPDAIAMDILRCPPARDENGNLIKVKNGAKTVPVNGLSTITENNFIGDHCGQTATKNYREPIADGIVTLRRRKDSSGNPYYTCTCTALKCRQTSSDSKVVYELKNYSCKERQKYWSEQNLSVRLTDKKGDPVRIKCDPTYTTAEHTMIMPSVLTSTLSSENNNAMYNWGVGERCEGGKCTLSVGGGFVENVFNNLDPDTGVYLDNYFRKISCFMDVMEKANTECAKVVNNVNSIALTPTDSIQNTYTVLCNPVYENQEDQKAFSDMLWMITGWQQEYRDVASKASFLLDKKEADKAGYKRACEIGDDWNKGLVCYNGKIKHKTGGYGFNWTGADGVNVSYEQAVKLIQLFVKRKFNVDVQCSKDIKKYKIDLAGLATDASIMCTSIQNHQGKRLFFDFWFDSLDYTGDYKELAQGLFGGDTDHGVYGTKYHFDKDNVGWTTIVLDWNTNFKFCQGMADTWAELQGYDKGQLYTNKSPCKIVVNGSHYDGDIEDGNTAFEIDEFTYCSKADGFQQVKDGTFTTDNFVKVIKDAITKKGMNVDLCNIDCSQKVRENAYCWGENSSAARWKHQPCSCDHKIEYAVWGGQTTDMPVWSDWGKALFSFADPGDDVKTCIVQCGDKKWDVNFIMDDLVESKPWERDAGEQTMMCNTYGAAGSVKVKFIGDNEKFHSNGTKCGGLNAEQCEDLGNQLKKIGGGTGFKGGVCYLTGTFGYKAWNIAKTLGLDIGFIVVSALVGDYKGMGFAAFQLVIDTQLALTEAVDEFKARDYYNKFMEAAKKAKTAAEAANVLMNYYANALYVTFVDDFGFSEQMKEDFLDQYDNLLYLTVDLDELERNL